LHALAIDEKRTTFVPVTWSAAKRAAKRLPVERADHHPVVEEVRRSRRLRCHAQRGLSFLQRRIDALANQRHALTDALKCCASDLFEPSVRFSVRAAQPFVTLGSAPGTVFGCFALKRSEPLKTGVALHGPEPASLRHTGYAPGTSDVCVTGVYSSQNI
jgi:hypothetical protein